MKTVTLHPKPYMSGESQNARETWEGKLEISSQMGITLTVIGPKPRSEDSYKHIITMSREEARALVEALQSFNP